MNLFSVWQGLALVGEPAHTHIFQRVHQVFNVISTGNMTEKLGLWIFSFQIIKLDHVNY